MTQRPTKTTRRKSAPPDPREDLADRPGAGLPGKSFIELITVQWQRERSDLDLSNFLLAIYLMRLGTIIELAFGRQCEERYGVSGSDMRVLFALRRGGPPYVKRPTDLFRALLVTSGAVTKKVDRLESLGMVERLQDPGHLGGFLVRLTKKGLHVADEMVEILARESAIAPAMRQFTKAEQEQCSRYALRMLSGLESAGLSEAPADEGSEAHTRRKRRVAS
jgi:DNA-binding MarR family transcriptional regulator